MNLIPESIAAAEDDAIWLLRELIRIDTTNAGHTGDTVGEAVAAEFVESVLREVGYDPVRFETTESNRQGVHLRIPGRDPDRGALLLHGHLDVVPAFASEWPIMTRLGRWALVGVGNCPAGIAHDSRCPSHAAL